MKIAIANDHRGYQFKIKLVKYLTKKGHEVIDLGCNSTTSADYPIYGFELGEMIARHEADLGIALCGTGIGISIACNKVKGIRCAKASNVKEAELARLHNDANILALSSSMPFFKVLDIVDVFLNTSFSEVSRHKARIEQITEYEKPKRKSRKEKQETVEEKEDEC